MHTDIGYIYYFYRCKDTTKPDIPKCSDDALQVAQSDEYCGLLSTNRKTASGVFTACVAHGAADQNRFYEECVVDVCAVPEDDKKLTACQALEAFAVACARAGFEPEEWRKKAGCGM